MTVVAALIERDGRVLIGQRRPGGRHPLKWEFPGGKLEAGEALQAALTRELSEELAIQAEIGEEVMRYEYRYPGGPLLLLVFFRVAAFQGELTNRDFTDLRWEERSRLSEYDFLAGDQAFVRWLEGQAGE